MSIEAVIVKKVVYTDENSIASEFVVGDTIRVLCKPNRNMTCNEYILEIVDIENNSLVLDRQDPMRLDLDKIDKIRIATKNETFYNTPYF